MKINFLRLAKEELNDASNYYEAQQQGLGEKFSQEVESTLERIRLLPNAWQPLSKNTRRCQTKKFPYAIIYQVCENEILIIAISHIRKKLNYWQNRIN
jgi:plasmid stabilization system protein ParE